MRALAVAQTDAAEARRLVEWAATGAVLLLLVKSGLLRRVQAYLIGKVSAPWLRMLVGAALTTLALGAARVGAMALSASIWPDRTGLSAAVRALFALPLNVLAGAGGLSLLVWAMRSWRRRGWIGLSLAAIVALFGLVLIPPLVLDPGGRGDRPASGPAATSILKFVRRGGLATERLYGFDSPDPFAVDVEGAGPFTHAAVSRAALTAPEPETYAALGHLLGHYRHKDLWSLALLWSAVAAGFFFAASQTIRRGAAENAPAMAALAAWAAVGLATPAFNVFDQTINYRADDDAMTLTRDPDGLCRWLMATEAAGKPDPGPVESILFYDHPPLAARLANAQRWKAAHRL